MEWPVTPEPSRAKARPLRPRRSCFGPVVEPPGTAPGSDRFITTPVYRHSRPLRDGTLNIGGEGLRRKGARHLAPPFDPPAILAMIWPECATRLFLRRKR